MLNKSVSPQGAYGSDGSSEKVTHLLLKRLRQSWIFLVNSLASFSMFDMLKTFPDRGMSGTWEKQGLGSPVMSR